MCVSKTWRERLSSHRLWHGTTLADAASIIPLGERTVVALRPWDLEMYIRFVREKSKNLCYLAIPTLIGSDCTVEQGICKKIQYVGWDDLQALHLFDCCLDTEDSNKFGFHSFPKLERLKIEACFNNLPGGLPSSLRSILVYGGYMSGETVGNWKRSVLPFIEQVDIDSPSVDGNLLRGILHLPCLDVDEDEEEGGGVEESHHTRHQTMRSLTRYNRDYPNFYLSRCMKLKDLTLSGPKFDPSWLVRVSRVYPELESLTLHGVTGLIDDEGLRVLCSYLDPDQNICPHLKELKILDCPLSDYDHLMMPLEFRARGVKFEHIECTGKSADPSYILRRPNEPPREDEHGDFVRGQWRLEQAVLARGL